MKKNNFISLVAIAAFMFVSCDKSNDVETIQNEDHLNKINASAFITFENNSDVMTPSGNTKANAEIKTMWDAYQEVVDYSVDPEKEAEYQQALEQYADILKPIGNNEYGMIISDPVVAKKFNSNGVLAVGNNVYLAEAERITKYEREGETLRHVEEFERPFAFDEGGGGQTGTPSSDYVITKTGEWLSNSHAVKVSSRRRVRVWMYAETYGDIGVSVGARSKYYRKNWKDHKSNNRLEFKCTKFTYTNSNGVLKTIYNETAMANTRDRVHLYAANRYVHMDGKKEYIITNPVVKFWRGSSRSGTAFVFEDFQ